MADDIQSAINEVRDQLFLDRADGKYLSNVTSNLNFERPLFGFSEDSLWRAVVRRIALDYRQVANLFYDLLTEIFGPRRTMAAALAVNGEVDDTTITIVEGRAIPQRGTIIINEGLIGQEEFEYKFRGPGDGIVELEGELANAQTAYGKDAESYLLSDQAVTATTLPLNNTNDFPTSGFPYPVLIQRYDGALEEVAKLTGNSVATNTLTIDAPGLANAQDGLELTPVISELTQISVGQMAIKLQNTRQFPEQGWIRVQQDVATGTPAENIYFTENDIDNSTLYLQSKLLGSYNLTSPNSVTATVLEPQVRVRLAQVQVKKVEWDIFQTEQNKLVLYIPQTLSQNQLRDVAFLHALATRPTAPNTAVQANTSIGDTEIKGSVGTLERFPASGLLIVNLGGGTEEIVHYSRQDSSSSTRLYADRGSGTYPIGTTQLFVEDITPIAEWDEQNKDKLLMLSRDQGSPNNEIVQYDELDVENNIITLLTATTKTHQSGSLVTVMDGDTFYLTQPMQYAHLTGEPLSVYQPIYAAGVQAAATITTAAGSLIAEGDMFVLDDGINEPVGFEFDSDASLVYDLNVQVPYTGSETPDQIRDLIIAAVNGVGDSLKITASNGGVATVALLHDLEGTVGNQKQRDYTTPSTFIVRNMKGGKDPLWDGRMDIRDSTGALIYTAADHLFQGPNLFNAVERIAEQTETSLSVNVAGPTLLEVTQHATRTTLEVQNASLFNTLGDFDVTVKGQGAAETLDVQGVVLRKDLTTASINGNQGSGIQTININAAGLLPAPSAGSPYGYRVIIDRGGANEEVVIVYITGVGTMTTEDPTTKAHNNLETVELMADVIELSERLAFDHEGRIPWSERKNVIPGQSLAISAEDAISTVHEERRWIEVASLTGFPPTGSYVIVNFGSRTLRVEARTTIAHAAGAGTLYLDDTSQFPTSGYPYYIEIDVGGGMFAGESLGVCRREYIEVSSNDTVANTLTLATNLLYGHPPGSEVKYNPGQAETLPYSSTLTGPNRLFFRSTRQFDEQHLKGEPVSLSGLASFPSKYGEDHAFYLPSTWAERLVWLFDRGRAAGVQVVVVTEK